MLGLEGEAVALAVRPSARTDNRAVQKVAGVELHSRLLSADREGTAGRPLLDASREMHPWLARENEVVVTAVDVSAKFVGVVLGSATCLYVSTSSAPAPHSRDAVTRRRTT